MTTTIETMTTTIMQFNTETIDYPKFSISGNNYAVINNDVSIIIFNNGIDASKWDTQINAIIKYYGQTQDIQYILEFVSVPFSFLLVDLNIHKPQYNAYFVIQKFDINSYYQMPDMSIIIGDNNGNNNGNNIKGVCLNRGEIHCYSLGTMVMSKWQCESPMIINTPPPFYITVPDFFNFIADEKQNNPEIFAGYGHFLLDILKSANNLNTDPLMYNYAIQRAIDLAQFPLDQYVMSSTLVKFYLLVFPESRFTERNTIIEFMEKTLYQ